MAPVLSLEESASAPALIRSGESKQEEPNPAASFAMVLQQKQVDQPPQKTGSTAQQKDQTPRSDNKNLPVNEQVKEQPTEAKAAKEANKTNEAKETKEVKQKVLKEKGQVLENAAKLPVKETKNAAIKPDATVNRPQNAKHVNVLPLSAKYSKAKHANAKDVSPELRGAAESNVRNEDPAPGRVPTVRANERRIPVQKEQAKPIRIATEPADPSNQAKTEKTTVDVLKARRPETNGSKDVPLGRDNVTKPSTQAGHQIRPATSRTGTVDRSKTGRRTPQVSIRESALLRLSETSTPSKTNRPKAAVKSKTRARAQSPAGEVRAQGQSETTSFNPYQKWLEMSSMQEQQSAIQPKTDKSGMDKPSGESKSQNLMGRIQAGLVNKLAQNTQKGEAVAPGTRSAKWMEALSHRTSLMDRSHPHWKVLEMRLEDGDGTVTIKVMRENDRVSVKIGFSDASLQAQAESQTSSILESLRARYDQDVNLSFTQREDTAFESSSFESGRRQKMGVKPSDAGVLSVETVSESVARGNRRVWIG